MLPAPKRNRLSSVITEDLEGPDSKPKKAQVTSYGNGGLEIPSGPFARQRTLSVSPSGPFAKQRTLSVSPMAENVSSNMDNRHGSVATFLGDSNMPAWRLDKPMKKKILSPDFEAPLVDLFSEMNVAVMNRVGRDIKKYQNKEFSMPESSLNNNISLSRRSASSGNNLPVPGAAKPREIDPFEELLNSVCVGTRAKNSLIPPLSSDTKGPLRASKKGRGRSSPCQEASPKVRVSSKFASDDNGIIRADRTHFGAPREIGLRDCEGPLQKGQCIVVKSSDELLAVMPAGTQGSAWLLSRPTLGPGHYFVKGKKRRGLIMSSGKTIVFVPSGSGPTMILDKITIPQLRIDGFSDRCLVPDALKTS